MRHLMGMIRSLIDRLIKGNHFFKCRELFKVKKLKSSIGQEPLSGESTTEYGVNYQLLAVIY